MFNLINTWDTTVQVLYNLSLEYKYCLQLPYKCYIIPYYRITLHYLLLLYRCYNIFNYCTSVILSPITVQVSRYLSLLYNYYPLIAVQVFCYLLYLYKYRISYYCTGVALSFIPVQVLSFVSVQVLRYFLYPVQVLSLITVQILPLIPMRWYNRTRFEESNRVLADALQRATITREDSNRKMYSVEAQFRLRRNKINSIPMKF